MHKFLKEIAAMALVDHQHENKAEDGAPEVSVVVDDAIAFPCQVGGVRQVNYGKKYARYTDGKEHTYLIPGLQVNRSKNDGGHATRCPEGAVARLAPFFKIRWNTGNDNAQEVKKEQAALPYLPFDSVAEKIKGNHVKGEMGIIRMHEAGGQETVILYRAVHAGRPKQELFEQAIVGKCQQRYRTGYDNQYKCQCHNAKIGIA